MEQLYKPGLCKGNPCPMTYPLSIRFEPPPLTVR